MRPISCKSEPFPRGWAKRSLPRERDLLLTLPSSRVPRLPGAERVRKWPLPPENVLPPVVTHLVSHERTARDPAHGWVRERLAALAGTIGAGEP